MRGMLARGCVAGTPAVLPWLSPCSPGASAGVRERQQRGAVRDPLPAEGDGEPDPVTAELRGERCGCHRRANQPRQVCGTPASSGAGGWKGRRRMLLWGEGNAAGIVQEQRGAGPFSLPRFPSSGGFSLPLFPALCLPLLRCPGSPLRRALWWGCKPGQLLAGQRWVQTKPLLPPRAKHSHPPELSWGGPQGQIPVPGMPECSRGKRPLCTEARQHHGSPRQQPSTRRRAWAIQSRTTPVSRCCPG